MKNTECTVYITTRHGRTWSYRRDKDGWTQTGPTGKVRRLTAEQLLSHLLPPLATGGQKHLNVRVERDVIRKKRRVPATSKATGLPAPSSRTVANRT